MPVDRSFGRLLQEVLKWRARRKFAVARAFLSRGSSVLDVGCGEGYVAAESARAGARPILLDTRRSARVPLPFVVADAEHLPFGDDAFDVGLLAYVLHHTRAPDDVVRECLRTCRRVIVWESVNVTPFGRALLSFLDRRANALRGMPPEHLQLDTSEGWIARFDGAGAALVHRRLLGSFVHRHELLVFDRARRQPSNATTA